MTRFEGSLEPHLSGAVRYPSDGVALTSMLAVDIGELWPDVDDGVDLNQLARTLVDTALTGPREGVTERRWPYEVVIQSLSGLGLERVIDELPFKAFGAVRDDGQLDVTLKTSTSTIYTLGAGDATRSVQLYSMYRAVIHMHVDDGADTVRLPLDPYKDGLIEFGAHAGFTAPREQLAELWTPQQVWWDDNPGTGTSVDEYSAPSVRTRARFGERDSRNRMFVTYSDGVRPVGQQQVKETSDGDTLLSMLRRAQGAGGDFERLIEVVEERMSTPGSGINAMGMSSSAYEVDHRFALTDTHMQLPVHQNGKPNAVYVTVERPAMQPEDMSRAQSILDDTVAEMNLHAERDD